MYARCLLISALLIASGVVSAHDDKGPHGGQITDAGSYHVELVVKSAVVDVFVSDANEKPVAATGYRGTAILMTAGKSQRIVLAPADGMRLSGSAATAFPGQPKGVVQLTAPDGKTIQAKFD